MKVRALIFLFVFIFVICNDHHSFAAKNNEVIKNYPKIKKIVLGNYSACIIVSDTDEVDCWNRKSAKKTYSPKGLDGVIDLFRFGYGFTWVSKQEDYYCALTKNNWKCWHQEGEIDESKIHSSAFSLLSGVPEYIRISGDINDFMMESVNICNTEIRCNGDYYGVVEKIFGVICFTDRVGLQCFRSDTTDYKTSIDGSFAYWENYTIKYAFLNKYALNLYDQKDQFSVEWPALVFGYNSFISNYRNKPNYIGIKNIKDTFDDAGAYYVLNDNGLYICKVSAPGCELKVKIGDGKEIIYAQNFRFDPKGYKYEKFDACIKKTDESIWCSNYDIINAEKFADSHIIYYSASTHPKGDPSWTSNCVVTNKGIYCTKERGAYQTEIPWKYKGK